MISISLEIVTLMCNHGQVLMVESETNINSFCLRFEENKGLEVLEALIETRQDQIYISSLRIMQEYWGVLNSNQSNFSNVDEISFND